jgi:hypothetical protein
MFLQSLSDQRSYINFGVGAVANGNDFTVVDFTALADAKQAEPPQ